MRLLWLVLLVGSVLAGPRADIHRLALDAELAGRYAESARLFDELRGLCPENQEIALRTVYCRYRAGDIGIALRIARELQDRGAGGKEIQAQVADFLSRCGQHGYSPPLPDMRQYQAPTGPMSSGEIRGQITDGGATSLEQSSSGGATTQRARELPSLDPYGTPNRWGIQKTVTVRDYIRKDGTRVRGHVRAPPRR